MKRLLIASNNQAKISDFKKFMADIGYEIVSPAELGLEADIKETGQTFRANAELKARHFFALTGLPTLADDGGIEIDALNGEPGVYSRRWKSRAEGLPEVEMTDEEIIEYTLFRLRKVPNEKRTARLTMTLCFIKPNQEPVFIAESIEGSIADHVIAEYTPGFPFRALFIVKEFAKPYSSLTEKEHAQINHRKIACDQIKKYL
ncbi:TPA: hypothetical protein DF272_06410 [Candidatus Falkowbacteria bacterium]|nr:hypothetical protein [Candidatus Falkowbacteria bacterium]